VASTITNRYTPDPPRTKLPVQRAWLYRPTTEWMYSHHAHLTFFNGRYLAMWSNGRVDEDAPGQRVLLSASEDFTDWSEPRPLIDTRQGKHSELVLTAAGWHEHNGTLVAYAGQYEYTPDALKDGPRTSGDKGHQDTTLRARTTTDGQHWSDLIDLKLPIVPNFGPQPTATGRLIISGNISYPYTDDPSGLSGWTMTGIYPPAMAEAVYDDSEGFGKVARAAGWPVAPCEGSFFQTDDGAIHMLLRTGTNHLWLTESRNDGASWSAPRPTDFTDNVAKFHFGRLPDGRFYYVGNPDPQPKWARCPLVLSLSDDGAAFGCHYILADEPYEMKTEGRYKGGQYGYPHTIIHDGHLCVICSRQKEAVEVLRTPLDALS